MNSPGPWHVDGPLDNYGDVDEPTGNTWFDVVSASGSSVAHLNLDARPEGQHLRLVQEDAHLIAAAPDLLDAARQARSALDKLMGDSDLPEDDSEEMRACQALSRAIDLATRNP